MLFWLLSKIKMLLPLWVLIKLHRNDKSLPVVLKTSSGNNYRIVMIDYDYGLVISDYKYDPDRLQHLKDYLRVLNDKQKIVSDEINMLTFEQREKLIYDEDLRSILGENNGQN